MPFTPFHFGPGAAIKAVAGRHFSFLVFCGTQVLMDLEPGIRLVLGTMTLHGHSHTLAGAVVIGALGMATGRPVTHWVLERGGVAFERMTWTAAATGAFVGSFSHVVFDAMLHPDMQPLWPLAVGNPLLGSATFAQFHRACVALAVVGGIGMLARWAWRRRALSPRRPGDGRNLPSSEEPR